MLFEKVKSALQEKHNRAGRHDAVCILCRRPTRSVTTLWIHIIGLVVSAAELPGELPYHPVAKEVRHL
jgi:hypothetical protein